MRFAARTLKPPLPARKARPPSSQTAFLVFATLFCGLIIRFAPLGLPRPVMKYGGSFLWALLIYWVVQALLPAGRLLPPALLAGAVATAVEFLKLYHSPGLDAFRLTLPGILLLGRFFSQWDVLVYWLAVVAGVLLQSQSRRLCCAYSTTRELTTRDASK